MRTHKYRGRYIVRGTYLDTTDDRADTWYIETPGSVGRRFAPGYRTLKDAKLAIDFLSRERGDSAFSRSRDPLADCRTFDGRLR